MSKLTNLTFIFKSGKEITFDCVLSWEIQTDGENVTGISLAQSADKKRRCIVKSICMKSIDIVYAS